MEISIKKYKKHTRSRTTRISDFRPCKCTTNYTLLSLISPQNKMEKEKTTGCKDGQEAYDGAGCMPGCVACVHACLYRQDKEKRMYF